MWPYNIVPLPLAVWNVLEAPLANAKYALT